MKFVCLFAILLFFSHQAFTQETIPEEKQILQPTQESEFIDFAEADSSKQIENGTTCVTFRTDIRGAEISINGIYKGTTPLSIKNLVPGNYSVKIEKKGWQGEKKYIQVENGISANYYFVLKKENVGTETFALHN